MLLAEDKKKTNIIEYLILIYQMEDLVRACNFDIDVLMDKFIHPHVNDEKIIVDYRKWYGSILQDLKSFNRQKHGHTSEVYEIQMELFYLHNSLLTVTPNDDYIKVYTESQEHINAFRDKTPMQLNDVDLCIYALHMKLLLKLKGKEINEESEKSFDKMRFLLASLAKAYHKMKKGDVAYHLN
jgi:hypothetical protein